MTFNVAKMQVFGNSNVGVYIFANDKIALVPPDMEQKDKQLIEDVLGVDVYEVTIMGTRLIGVLVAGNNNGLLVPSTITEGELQTLKEALGNSMNIGVVPSSNNAIGNLVAANSHGALVYPGLDNSTTKLISDVLGVEVAKRAISGISTVGAVIAVTDIGGLSHPDTGDDELEFLKDLFKVPFKTGTINFGVSFIKTGLVVNNRGAIVGANTSGPEIARIQMVFSGL
ncbi:Translation initiation factor 6 [Acidilobus saccharovorans 345-15]|uniref:Translation initiation factor 6 n=1 Tax=Acidilobus saccharovorans (strain DSM 16705 / JCM 18335 / VKM B-2471 / 345-15) TaxID=666510 RepID=D9Q2J6_ACIS3|nr:translation initiation factor IF-6 [Acidilobus saccharovorans]ADL19534.1 Translation initiation factor 6 [Acidilobus saccharovorans 345-15]